jgi:general stress protein 26
MGLLTDEVRAFLQKPLVARMSTIDQQGYPHTVPVWFKLDGDDVMIIAERSTRKIGHIARNPKGAICIGGDSGDGCGYLLKGVFSVEEDPGLQWMKTLCYHYEDREQAEKDIEAWSDLDMIVIRMKVERVIKVA